MVQNDTRENDILSGFAATYAHARKLFLDVVAERGAKLLSFPHPTLRGSEGEELFIDIAIMGNPAVERSLLLVSGTHGQEGMAGSAIQIAFLRQIALESETNIVAVHALNPWAVSHSSRTNEDNVDLNRNFRDFPVGGAEDEIYRSLHECWCPDDWTEANLEWLSTFSELIKKYGRQRVIDAATGGQSIEPTGLNYSGTAPTWSHRVLAEHLPQVLKNSKKIAYIDWHTGIGAYGDLCYMCLSQQGSPPYERVFQWMGDAARSSLSESMELSSGVVPNYTGMLSAWLPSIKPDAEWAGLVIEVGTYNNAEIADALRIDRWLKFGSGQSDWPRDVLKSKMMERLYPTDPEWRLAAIEKGLAAQYRAYEGLLRWT